MALSKLKYNSLNVTPAANKGIGFDSGADDLSTDFAGGDIRFIKKLTASSSATISFVDGTSDVVLDNTYKEYLFTFNNMHPATDNAEFQFNLSVDSGSNYNVAKTTTLFKARLSEADGIQELGYETGSDLAQGTGAQPFTYAGIENHNDASLSGYLRIFDPSSTTFVKHFLSGCNYMAASGTDSVAYNSFIAGYGNTTSAVDAIQFSMSSGNVDAGDICLYGIN